MRSISRGLSLIEFMVAAAAVSVACAMAIPTVSSYMDRARTNRAVNDIGTTSIRLHKWRASHGAFPATLAQAGIVMPPDPWGRAYIYQNVSDDLVTNARVHDRYGRLNSDFDLYSLGPDGMTTFSLAAAVAHDDVVRANNGSYIGLSRNY